MDFNEENRGYDRSQVDRYIQMLQSEYESMQNEFQALTQRCESLSYAKRENDQSVAASKREADQILFGAKYEADQTLSSAKREADQILISVRREADQTLAGAKREADQILAGARSELDDLVMAKLKITTDMRDIYSIIGKYIDIPRPFERNETP